MYTDVPEQWPTYSTSLLTFRLAREELSPNDTLAFPSGREVADTDYVLQDLSVADLEDRISSRVEAPIRIARTFDLDRKLLEEIRSQSMTEPSFAYSQAGFDVWEDPLGLTRTFTLRLLPDPELAEAQRLTRLRDLAAKLENLEGIEDVALVPLRYAMYQPSDEGYGDQWHHRAIGSEYAWDITMGDPKVGIAVIDTGVDLNHGKLQENLGECINVTQSPEFIDPPISGYELDDPYAGPDKVPQDVSGHGTHVAGIIGAREGNGDGGVGVAPKCTLIPIKCMVRFTHQLHQRPPLPAATSVEVTNAILAAAAVEGVRVINLSLGGQTPTQMEFRALQAARDRDCVVVVSSGNDGGFKMKYPAAYKANRPDRTEHMMVVGATTRHNFIAEFSNFGDILDVVAPGHDIYSTWLNGQSKRLTGTSMAAPIVAGLAALLFSKRPEATAHEVIEAINRTAVGSPSGRKSLYFGYGRVNAEEALRSF
jgi:cell wall-associated protease